MQISSFALQVTFLVHGGFLYKVRLVVCSFHCFIASGYLEFHSDFDLMLTIMAIEMAAVVTVVFSIHIGM